MELYNRSSNLNPINAISIILVSHAYCFYFVKEVPKGILRLIFLLPIFYALSIIPWCFITSVFLRGITSFFITWLTSFKLLLFSYHKGSLSTCNNYMDFAIVATLPIKVKLEESTRPLLNLHVLFKLLGLLILLHLTFTFFQNMGVLPLTPELASLFGHLILGSSIFALPCIMPHLEFVPILNKPYLATSLKDFWGKRWNRISSNILRETIYDPIRDALEPLIGAVGSTATVRLVAAAVTLTVSGVMHELVFYYITCGKKPSWEMTWFFVMQGACMGVEAVLKWWWLGVRKWPAPHPVFSRVLTLGFVLFSSYRLLLLPVLRSGQITCSLI